MPVEFGRSRSVILTPAQRKTRTLLIGLCLLAFVLSVWGIRRDLPYVHDYDENPFVMPAYAMAVTGGWDPHWFGHPGSTMIYPLRMIYSCWIAYAHSGRDFEQAAAVSPQAAFEQSPSEYFYIGRLLSIAYLVASVPLLYLLARRIFGEGAALWGSLLWMVMPIVVSQAQITRSDSATLFFGALTLDLLERFLRSPSQKLRLWTAVAVACAISSHYKMACLGPLWLWAEWHVRRRSDARQLRGIFVAGLLLIAVFVVLNPYLFVHLDALRRNLASQTPLQHPGADGLSPPGNLAWYLLFGIPDHFGWVAYALSLAGAALVLSRGSVAQKLMPGFVVLYLLGIIWSPLHWPRWVSVILPPLSFLSIHALIVFTDRLPQVHRRWLRPAALAVLLVPPLISLVFQNIRNSSFNTRMQAAEWVRNHLPPESRIAYEWYTAPLRRQPFNAVEIHALPARGDLKSYCASGFRYLIVGNNMYDRFLGDPERYASECRFYNELFSTGKLEASFKPSSTIGGPEIRIYRID